MAALNLFNVFLRSPSRLTQVWRLYSYLISSDAPLLQYQDSRDTAGWVVQWHSGDKSHSWWAIESIGRILTYACQQNVKILNAAVLENVGLLLQLYMKFSSSYTCSEYWLHNRKCLSTPLRLDQWVRAFADSDFTLQWAEMSRTIGDISTSHTYTSKANSRLENSKSGLTFSNPQPCWTSQLWRVVMHAGGIQSRVR